MEESLALFELVINSWWFLQTSIILFLNKIDVFKVKLPKVLFYLVPFSTHAFLTSTEVPLEKYFPEYTGGADINKAVKFILWRFMKANRARFSVYSQLVAGDCLLAALANLFFSLTQATDTSNIQLVFMTVKKTILRNALKDSRIL